MRRDPPSLDSAFAGSPVARRIAFAVCTPLVTYPDVEGDAGKTLVPGLAQDLPETSRDSRRFTFRLKRDLRFADGRPLGPRDLRATFERLLDPALASPAAGLYDDILGARAYREGRAERIRGINTSRREVRFRLAAPDPGFLARLALAYACPVPEGTPHRELSRSLWTRAATGPYLLARYLPGRQIVLRRNPRYDPDLLGPRGGADAIRIAIGASGEQAAERIARGAADLPLDGLPASVFARLASDARARVRSALLPSGELAYLALDTRANPLGSARVRRALGAALDRDAIVAAAGGAAIGRASSAVLTPALPRPVERSRPAPRPDPARARALLLQSGLPLPVQLTLSAGRGARDQRVARLIAEQLGRAGIQVRLLAEGEQRRPGKTLRLARYTAPYADPGAVVDFLLGGGRGGEREDCCATSLRARRALRYARHQTGESRVEQLGRFAGRLMQDEAPIVVLWHANFPVATSSRLVAMAPHPVHTVDLAALRLGS